MTSLESTTFGSINRTVSRLGFGGAPAGLTNYLTEYSPEQIDQREQVIAAIQHAADSGITYFDTAAAYGKGESERIFGEALAGRVMAPAEVLHAEENDPSTGSGWQAQSGQEPPLSNSLPRREGGQSSPSPESGEGWGEGQSDFAKNGSLPETTDPPSNSLPGWEGEQAQITLQQAKENEARLFLATKVAHAEPDIRGSVERSLRNLRVDRIDLVQVHGGSYTDEDEDIVMRSGGVLEILEKARDEGLVRHIGFTTEDQNAAVYRFIESGRFEMMQVQYNLLFQHPYSPDRPFGCMIAAKDAGMGVVTMRSLTSGVFQRWMSAIRPDDHFDYSAALMQFTLSNPLIDVALAGMRTPDEVDRNMAVLNDKSGRIDLEELHRKFV